MNRQQAATNFVQAFADLQMNQHLSNQERDDRGHQLSKELIELDDDELLSLVMGRLSLFDGELYRFLATQIEYGTQEQTISQEDESYEVGTLIAIPVICYSNSGVSVPDRIEPEFLPTFQDGTRIPYLSSVLLDWSDIYVYLSRVTQLHKIFSQIQSYENQISLDNKILNWRGRLGKVGLVVCNKKIGC